MVNNFLCKDEKSMQKYLLTFAKNFGVERSPSFSRTVYPNRNHVTTHPCYKIMEVMRIMRSVSICKAPRIPELPVT